MKLEGGERLVLKMLLELQGDSGENVEDFRVAAATKTAVQDVRDWLETMEGKGFVERARLTEGFSAHVTAKGKLAIRMTEDITNPQPVGTASPKSSGSVHTILILAANPKGTQPFRFDEEVKKIEQGLERTKRRDQFTLVQKWAVKIQDLYGPLLVNEPEIVHFSGCGNGRDGLTFEDDSGQTHLIPGDALGRFFKLCSDSVKCVVLNACCSEAQADAIAKHIDYVVGMKKAIGDVGGSQVRRRLLRCFGCR